MIYKILKSFAGSPDGRYCVRYQEGQEAELTDSLATVAITEGWAKAIVNDIETEPQTAYEAPRPKRRYTKRQTK